MTHCLTRPRVLIVAALTLLALAGCTTSPRHQENVDAANQRWLSLRSGLMLQTAMQQFETGDLDQAEMTLVEAIQMDPENPELHVLAGRIALEKGQLERAYNRLQAAIELDDQNTTALYYQGIVLQRWQRFEQALACYEKAYELLPDNASYLMAVGEMLVALGREDEALDLLSGKLIYFDQNAGLRSAVGHLYMMRRQFNDAVAAFKEATILAPDELQFREDLATAYLAARDYDSAINVLRELLRHKDYRDRDDLQLSLGQAYESAGRTEDAKQLYLSLARRDRQNAEAWIRLGQLAWREKDWSGAMLAANRAIEAAPRRHEGYLLAGLVWQQRGNLDRALDHFDQAAGLAPDSAMPLILRGIALEQSGRREAAAKAYEHALQREPQHPKARQLLSRVATHE